jgi:hypothetical protein
MIRGSNSGGSEIFRTRNDHSGTALFCYRMRTESLSWGQICRVDHSTHLALRLKKEYSYITVFPFQIQGMFQEYIFIYNFTSMR